MHIHNIVKLANIYNTEHNRRVLPVMHNTTKAEHNSPMPTPVLDHLQYTNSKQSKTGDGVGLGRG